MKLYKNRLMYVMLIILVISLNLIYIPTVMSETPVNNDVAMFLRYKRDFDRRTEIIDRSLVYIVNYYKLRNHYLLVGNQSQASKYTGTGDILVNKAIEQIYKYHKDDVKAILKDLLETDIILYKVAKSNRNLAIQMLFDAGYNYESAVQLVDLSLKYKGNIDQVRKGYNLIINNDQYLKAFIKYMVYEDIKNMLIDDNPSIQPIHLQGSKLPKTSSGKTKYIKVDSVSFPDLNVHFVQLKAEMRYSTSGIDCGHHPFTVNVNDPLNTLYMVVIHDYSDYSNGWYYYVLEFWYGDEDYPIPSINAIYDQHRINRWKRIQDVEEVAIYSYNHGSTWTVDFSYGNIWSQGHAYAYLLPFGIHGNIRRTVSRSVTIFVSDVWNHAMDTVNHNACGKTPYIQVSPVIVWS